MVRYQLQILLAIFCTPFISFAQDYVVSGIVKDATTGEVLISATVAICNEITTTNLEGTFSITVDEVQCPLEIRYLGYEVYTEIINLPIEDGTQFIAFLQPSSNILNQAVITASKFQKRQSESTVSLEVLKPEIFSKMNTNAVDVALDAVPGVDVIDGQANIRGGSGYSYGTGSRVLLVIDEMPALQYDAGVSQWADIAMENIAQVEILKGASSVIYGSAALNGVISFSSQEPTKTPRTKAGISYRHYSAPKDVRRQWWVDEKSPFQANAYFVHSRKINKIDFTLGAFGTTTDSYNRYSYSDKGRVYTRLGWRLSPKIRFQLNADVNFGESASFFYWGNALRESYQPGDNTLGTSKIFRYKVDPSVSIYDKRGDKHVLKARWYGIVNDNDDNQGNQSNSQYINYTYRRDIPDWKSKLLMGIDGLSNQTDSELFSNARYTAYNTALFVQLDKKITDGLNIVAGARYEYNALNNPAFDYMVGDTTLTVSADTKAEGKPVFRFGLNYNPRNGTYLRASWGQGYRYPTIAEKFTTTNAGGLTVIPNPNLASETGWSTEIGIRQELKFDFVAMYIDVAGFYSQYNNMIEFTLASGTTAGFSAQNIGNTAIPGLETSWGSQWDVGALKIRSMIGYTYIDPSYRNFDESIKLSGTVDDNILKYRNRHSLKSQFSIELWGFSFWMNQRYNSHTVSIDRTFEQFISGIADFRQVFDKGYNVIGFQVGYQYKDWRLSLNIDNAFNTTYTERPAFLEAPRNFSVRLDCDISNKTK